MYPAPGTSLRGLIEVLISNDPSCWVVGLVMFTVVVSFAAMVTTPGFTGVPQTQEPLIRPVEVPVGTLVSLTVQFAVGSQNDPPGKEGLAFLTGQMIADAGLES